MLSMNIPVAVPVPLCSFASMKTLPVTMNASTSSSSQTRSATKNASTSSIPTRSVTMHASTSSIPTTSVTMHSSPSSIPTRAIKSMKPYTVDPPYNVDPYILDPTKMDMIQNSDNEENRQEVVDLLSVSMHAMLMAAYRWKIKRIELKESCEQHGFVWSDVDDIMRFGVKLAKQEFTMTLSTSGLVTMNK